MFFEFFCVFNDFFHFSEKIGFLGILGAPYCGIGATIRIGREMLCLPYAGFLIYISGFKKLLGTWKLELLQLCLYFGNTISYLIVSRNKTRKWESLLFPYFSASLPTAVRCCRSGLPNWWSNPSSSLLYITMACNCPTKYYLVGLIWTTSRFPIITRVHLFEIYFQRIGPLGRFFLQVEMSVCLSVCLCVCLSVTLFHSV